MRTSRDDLAARVRRDHAVWRELLRAVPRERMDEPGAMGDWPFRDVVSHLAAWRNRTIRRLEAAARGEARPPDPWPAAVTGDDPINAWLRERDAGRSVDELIEDYDGSFERLARAIEAMPADTSFQETTDAPGYYAWPEGAQRAVSDFTDHLRSHAADVREWLAGD